MEPAAELEARRAELGRELAASVWMSETEQIVIVEASQYDMRHTSDAGRFAQPDPWVMPFATDARQVGRAAKAALVRFRGVILDPREVTGPNYPAAVAAGIPVREGFAGRYRALAVETRADRIQVDTTIVDETDERSDTLALLGTVPINCDEAELGELITRVFRFAQYLQSAVV